MMMMDFNIKKIVVVVLSVFSFYGNSGINKCEQALQNEQYSKLLEQLNRLHEESNEENFEVFSETARTAAKNVLYHITSKFPDNEYIIYPTQDREIMIEYTPADRQGRGIAIELDSDGGVAFFVTIDGKNSKHRYDSYSDLPYDLLKEYFKRLKE